MGKIKQIIKSLFRFVGYELSRVHAESLDPDSIAAANVADSHLYKKWCTRVPLFAAWLGDVEFAKIYEGMSKYTLVSIDRCYLLYCMARHAATLTGDFAECGVYKGGTALLLAEMMKANKTIHLFDSFLGLPEPDARDNYYKAGTFSDTSLRDVSRVLRPHANHIKVHRGWMPDTFNEVEGSSFSLVHVDVDLYRTAKACCEFFYPRLAEGGVLIFDDYGFPACRGEKDAVDQFFSWRIEKPICLPTGQALVIKQRTPEFSLTA
jgi:O-methyltransferase